MKIELFESPEGFIAAVRREKSGTYRVRVTQNRRTKLWEGIVCPSALEIQLGTFSAQDAAEQAFGEARNDR